MSDLLHPGQEEPLKLGVHVGLGVLAAACCAYNLAAWWRRRELHLFSNTIAYGLILVLEVGHAKQHAEQFTRTK